jgi:PAP2 superfamily
VRRIPPGLLGLAAAVTALAAASTGSGVTIGTGATATAAAPTASVWVGVGTEPMAMNAAVEWNQALLAIVSAPPAPGATPSTIHTTRSFAMLAAAVDDAVDAIDHTHTPYLRQPAAPAGASPSAAAAVAGHDVLVALYPAQRLALDNRLTDDLAALPAGRSTQDGAAVGHSAAAAVVAARAADGASAVPPPYVTTGAPGDFRPTPPGFAAAMFTGWGHVAPFVLRGGDQFRPPPPPALTSPAYARALSEVQRLGSNTSTTRTAAQTQDALFWAAPIQNYWNAIAEQVATDRHTDLDHSARLFAQLDLSLADATIALYDAKYTYRLWRPVTAVREAGADSNPATTPDPTWTPLATTPADPSYPGAHSDLSAAAATVLTRFYGDHDRFTVASPTLPGGVHAFSRFSDAVTEAGLSRIYAGVHTRTDHRAGRRLGLDVADYVLSHTLRPAGPAPRY